MSTTPTTLPEILAHLSLGLKRDEELHPDFPGDGNGSERRLETTSSQEPLLNREGLSVSQIPPQAATSRGGRYAIAPQQAVTNSRDTGERIPDFPSPTPTTRGLLLLALL